MRPFFYHYERGLFFFRLFGYGIHVKDISRFRQYFSERNGYKRRLMIGNYAVSILKP